MKTDYKYVLCKDSLLVLITLFQLAKMFIVVLIVFGVCWLPYHAYFFYTYYHAVSLHKLQSCCLQIS